ncbi:hypothetical protein K435DRAFT_865813 [Dendrothele bispora CBS 962.96]|uniref:Atg29 N-terminal domain-containing protein n=1 Tax=Dendrothele bispora (strain CBS 962.96) TaxID=1314807 RepID=A0A4S8LIK7_DENBC|nr:hypothetical protein K435DRAFT_865813 [Dendrothele bispora CBS 962.96]
MATIAPLHIFKGTQVSVLATARCGRRKDQQPLQDPIEWNDEKAEILWKVIERSRAIDSGGADWKGLAQHLQVPLPYLLYRVHARYEEDLRGLKDIQGVLSPSLPQPAEEFPLTEPQTVAGRAMSRLAGSSRLSNSGHTSTLSIRARLNSLGANSPRKASSSSTLTLQTPKKPPTLLRPTLASSDDDDETDSEEEEMLKEEEAGRSAEGTRNFGSVGRSKTKGKGRTVDRGRMGLDSITSPRSMQNSFRQDAPSSRSTSQSVSSASSPQGSVPEIPSPTDSLPRSPMSRHMSISPRKSSSPPAISPRSAVGQSHRRYGHLHGSNHGSEASTSSFSDLSGMSKSSFLLVPN